MRSVCVFCGSSLGTREAYGHAARALGEELVGRRQRLVYGGAHVGLMGVLADTVLSLGGEVIGVIPRGLETRELAHSGLTELHITETMHERKALMGDLAGAFIALPGGLGTLEEFAEVLTWSQLGLQRKTCGLLDVESFYASLLASFDHMVEEGFLGASQRQLVLSDTDPARLLDRLAAWSPDSGQIPPPGSTMPPAEQR
jgi:uncharacterized protein (TIGR00730 family)